MKIRQGFVSNSSTSSFCLFGVGIEGSLNSVVCELLKEKISINSKQELIDYIKKNKMEDDINDITDENWEDYKEDVIVEDADEDLTRLLKGTCLSYVNDYDADMVYIGRSYEDIEDDETGKEFKENVKKDLKKLGIKGKPEHQEGTIAC